MSKGIFLQLGSNMGDRANHLSTAKQHIEKNIGEILCSSKVYETKAWGFTAQDDFLNEVISITTTKTPHELMDACLSIEELMERKRVVKWGPRNIDIDILFYDNHVIRTEKLILPHPRIQERLFVLQPLCDVAPYFIHPTEGITCKDMLGIVAE